MSASNLKLIGWLRLLGLVGFLLGIGVAVYEATWSEFTKADVAPVAMLLIGGAVLFIGGAHLPKLLRQ